MILSFILIYNFTCFESLYVMRLYYIILIKQLGVLSQVKDRLN